MNWVCSGCLCKHLCVCMQGMVCMLQINMSECVHSVYSGFEESMCVYVCVRVCVHT